jgi:hypothetical protein
MRKLLIGMFFVLIFINVSFSQSYISKEMLRVNWGGETGKLGLFYGGPEPSYDFPKDMTIDSKGNVYIADYVNKRIVKYNNKGEFIANLGEGYGDVRSDTFFDNLGIDGDGNIYSFDRHNRNIVKFNSNGNVMNVLDIKNAEAGVQMQVNQQGVIYVNDFVAKKKYAKKGKLFGVLNVGEEYSAENSDFLYESPSGNTYDFKKVDNKLRFERTKKASKGLFGITTTADTTEKDLSATFHANKGDRFIGFDKDDNYYVSDYHYKFIRKYDPDGNLIVQLELPKNPGIEGYEFRIVKVDDKGNIYNFLYDDKEAWIVKMEKQ